MPPRASKKTAALVDVKPEPELPAVDEVEEIVPAERGVTFVLEQTGFEGLDHPPPLEEDDEEDLEDEEDYEDAVGQVAQLLMTEEGEAVADVMRGILDAIDKQNKILYRGLQLLEAKFGGRR